MSKIHQVRSLLQAQPSESGSTCLAMIAGYYGKWVSLLEVAKLCAVNKDGCSLQMLALGAEKLGFQTERRTLDIEKTDTNKILSEITSPAIFRRKDMSYVVYQGCRRNKVYLCTPEAGKTKVNTAEFRAMISGEILLLNKGDNFVQSGKRFNPITFASSVIGKSGKNYVRKYLFSMTAVTVAFIVFPFLNSFMIDRVMDSSDLFFQRILLAVYIACLIAVVILEIVNIRKYGDYEANVEMTSEALFFQKLLYLPNYYYDRRSTGYYMNCCENNRFLTSMLSTSVIEMVFNFGMVVICIFAIGAVSLRMLCVLAAMVVVTYFLMFLGTRREQDDFQALFSSSNDRNAYLLSGLGTMATIRNFCAQEEYYKTFSEKNAAVTRNTYRYEKKAAFYLYLSLLINQMTMLLLIIVGIIFIADGMETYGTVVAIQGIFSILSKPISDLGITGSCLFSMKYAMENIQSIFSTDADKKTVDNKAKAEDISEFPGKLQGEIILKDVSFRYDPYGPYILKDINMTVQPSECIGIVGMSGCGKTTLKRLITGSLEQEEGEIRFDGFLRDTIPANIFSNSVASVDQDIILFPGTVMDNIKMWDETIMDFEGILASRDAELHDTVMSRTNGYGTQLTEMGNNFSGGERQRIEIARALAQDPTILILDEATSALDTIVEKRIVERIRERGTTTVVIAHRLSTIRLCNRIFVLDKGKIIDCGTHDELMARCPLYHELVTVE